MTRSTTILVDRSVTELVNQKSPAISMLSSRAVVEMQISPTRYLLLATNQIAPKGEPGDPGLSSYQVWLGEGNTGSVEDFLESQRGPQGKSNYQLWLEDGNTGSLEDFFETLRGPAPLPDWGFFKDHWSIKPTKVATLAGMTVWSYTLEGITRFRRVPSPYVASSDSFFSSFDGTALSGLIASKG